jgi:thioredoxin-related protein
MQVAALMRALLSALAAALMLLLVSQDAGQAGLDAAPASTPTLEVLVFEHADCVYCRVFRRDVLPRYHEAVRANVAPLRFVDIEKGDTAGLRLNSRVDTLPTAVVMRNGREVDRIVGYWGPTGFFQLLSHILAKME